MTALKVLFAPMTFERIKELSAALAALAGEPISPARGVGLCAGAIVYSLEYKLKKLIMEVAAQTPPRGKQLKKTPPPRGNGAERIPAEKGKSRRK